MKKNDVDPKSLGTAKTTTSRPQVTDGRKAAPAVHRPVHPPTPKEQATWLLYLWDPDPKLPVEEADFRIERCRYREKERVLNVNKLPEVGFAQAAQEWRARFQKARVDAPAAAKRQERGRRLDRPAPLGAPLCRSTLESLLRKYSQANEGGGKIGVYRYRVQKFYSQKPRDPGGKK